MCDAPDRNISPPILNPAIVDYNIIDNHPISIDSIVVDAPRYEHVTSTDSFIYTEEFTTLQSSENVDDFLPIRLSSSCDQLEVSSNRTSLDVNNTLKPIKPPKKSSSGSAKTVESNNHLSASRDRPSKPPKERHGSIPVASLCTPDEEQSVSSSVAVAVAVSIPLELEVLDPSSIVRQRSHQRIQPIRLPGSFCDKDSELVDTNHTNPFDDDDDDNTSANNNSVDVAVAAPTLRENSHSVDSVGSTERRGNLRSRLSSILHVGRRSAPESPETPAIRTTPNTAERMLVETTTDVAVERSNPFDDDVYSLV